MIKQMKFEKAIDLSDPGEPQNESAIVGLARLAYLEAGGSKSDSGDGLTGEH